MAEFLFGTTLKPDADPPKFGIVPLLWGTFMVAAGSSLIALPIGLLSAIYLSEYAPRPCGDPQADARAAGGHPHDRLRLPGAAAGDARAQAAARAAGLARRDVQRAVRLHRGRRDDHSAGLVAVSEDVLSAVPRGLREAAFGLGATKFEVSTRVVLPAALSGVFASFILAVSRAVGETMAVVLAAGMRPQITLEPADARSRR